jgi:hypothetical protein
MTATFLGFQSISKTKISRRETEGTLRFSVYFKTMIVMQWMPPGGSSTT